MKLTWDRPDEPGWYTSEAGGICEEEKRKWYFYPRSGNHRVGPFKTLIEAKAAGRAALEQEGKQDDEAR